MWKMTSKSVWNPWHELFDVDRTLAPLLNAMTGRYEFPPTNVWCNENTITFTFEVPGMKADDFDISAKADTLTLKGQRSADVLPENASYIKQERGAGSFTRSYALPFKIDPEGVKANYVNGILTITLPKAVEVQPRKITIGNN